MPARNLERMTHRIVVDGMTCRACEVRVQRAIGRLDGVREVSASAAGGVVTIRADRELGHDELVAALARAGEDYRLSDGRRRAWFTRDVAVWRDLGVAAAVVALLAVLLVTTGVTSLADRIGTSATSGSLLVVALVGVAAGFSTCMALVGGLVLAFSARSGAAAADAGRSVRWAPHLAFNVGRVVGFAALGALTGLVGSAVTVSGMGLAVAMIAVSVVMVLLAAQLSGASPRLAGGLLPALPDVLSRRLQRTADGSGGQAQGVAVAAGVGAATYLLPCGITQAVQLYALSTGSPVMGAAVMAAFAVGTAPGLLTIAGLSVGLRGAWAVRFGRFAAVAVLAFALVNAGGAVTLLRGGAPPPATPGATTVSANVRVVDGVQHVTTTQEAGGYEPESTVVMAGLPVVWEVTSTALSCASWLSPAPELGVPPDTVLMPGSTAAFRFTPTAPGTLTYSCGMGMYSGSFEVIEQR